jgi:hypothetical protein
MLQQMFSTTELADIGQRHAPLEHIGLMIATKGTKPYVHLQLEQNRVLFGDSMPTIVCNDGPDDCGLAELCAEYQAELFCDEKPLGHTTGDVRSFTWGIDWALRANVQILVKFSRRFVPLVPWRHQLYYLAGLNRHAAAFTRFHEDSPVSLFRTDAIGLRVEKWNSPQIRATFAETMTMQPERVNVENIFGTLSNTIGGMESWDLLGRDFYRAAPKSMQWRGIMPHCYADLSRWLKLPYTEADFIDGTLTVPQYLSFDPVEQAKIQEDIRAVEASMVDDRPRGPTLWRIADTKEALDRASTPEPVLANG